MSRRVSHYVCDIRLRMANVERSVSELLSNVLGAFGMKRSYLVECAVLEETVTSTEQRDAAWVEYIEAMGAQLAEAADTLWASLLRPV